MCLGFSFSPVIGAGDPLSFIKCMLGTRTKITILVVRKLGPKGEKGREKQTK